MANSMAPGPSQPAFSPAQTQPGYTTQGRGAPSQPIQGWSPPPNGGAYGQQQAYPSTAAQSLADAISQGRGAGQQPYAPPAYAPAPNYGSPSADPYAPQFEPYAHPSAQQHRAPGQQQAAPAYAPYSAPTQGYVAAGYAQPQAAPQAVSHGGYGAERAAAQREPNLNAWTPPNSTYASDSYQQQTVDDLGFAQAAGGELDPNYGEEEQDYEYEDAPPRRRPTMVMAALCGAIIVGGGLAYGYKTILGDGPGGQPPVIKSASEPSRIKPADAGGKQFAHSDSKLMGRLGSGSSGSAAAATSASASEETDPSGTRKVATLVVGRDGSIQAPAASPLSQPMSESGVPGLALVDSFGPQGARPAAPQPAAAAEVVNAAPAPQKVVVSPPPVKQPPPQSTGSVDDAATEAAPAAPAPAKPKKVAALAPAVAADTAPSTAQAAAPVTGGASGFVAVLASVPTSSTSRMDALKRFADMQQKYGSTLNGKTPDVAEANLGAKGNYHRLVVGPPASREQASSVCTQLKSQGYNDCWVTAY
ncbi:MAG: SPOR domain-containing protein [Hyphomicrobium sp.]